MTYKNVSGAGEAYSLVSASYMVGHHERSNWCTVIFQQKNSKAFFSEQEIVSRRVWVS